MPELIEILREDHRNIETLLLVLERELNIFDRAEQPDYEVVQAIIDYFRDYPDRCHHRCSRDHPGSDRTSRR